MLKTELEIRLNVINQAADKTALALRAHQEGTAKMPHEQVIKHINRWRWLTAKREELLETTWTMTPADHHFKRTFSCEC